MAEKGHSGRQATGTPNVVSVVRDHRANDVILGHVGRLTYVSPEDGKDQNSGINGRDGVGTLLMNRNGPEESHTFKKVTALQTWYPPSASDSVPDGRPDPRGFLHLLLREAPEALAGTAGPPYPDITQIARESGSLKPLKARLPLLAYGEINGLAAGESAGCMALAMAAGESGHVLRVARLNDEKWGWSETGNVSVKLFNVTPAAEDEGHWCSNGLAINQIKFSPSSHDPSAARWLLVQTVAETIVFEARLHNVPVRNSQCACDSGRTRHSYMSVEPIIRIHERETGGKSHCDVALNPSEDGKPAQLAIVDVEGHWSVWNLDGSGQGLKNSSGAILQVQGNVLDVLMPNPQAAAVEGLGHLHRIAWLPPFPSTVHEQMATESARDKGKHTPKRKRTTVSRSNTLLLCNATSVKAVDIDDNNSSSMLLRTFHITHSNAMEVVLDLYVSPLNTSHVFILTTTTLFWFDLSSQEPTATAGGSRQAPAGPRTNARQPLVLLSCPHLMDPAERTAKLYLAPLKSRKGADTIVAFVYSMKHHEAAAFWFSKPRPGQPAMYQQQVVQFFSPTIGSIAVGRKTELNGLQTLLVLPRRIRHGSTHNGPNSDAGLEYASVGAELFQAIILGTDLSLQFCLCTSSPNTPSAVPTPPPSIHLAQKNDRKRNDRPAALRRATLNFFSSRFVVSDELDESLHSKGLNGDSWGKENTQPLSPRRDPIRTFQIYNVSRVFKLLSENMARAARTAYEAATMARGFQNPSPISVIQQVIDSAQESGSFAFTTLLDVIDDDYTRYYGANLTDLSWAKEIAELGPLDERRISVFSRMPKTQARSGVPSTMFEALERLCPVLISSLNQQEEDAVMARQQGILAHAAVQLFFAQISIVIMPRQAVLTGEADDRMSALSTPFSSHFPRSASESGFHAGVSSPAVKGMPDWLLSSPRHHDIARIKGDADTETRSHGLEATVEGEGEEEEQEDPTIARLRQYSKSIKSQPLRVEGEMRLLSHWELGSDPWQFHWVPLGAAGEAEEEARQQMKEEARARQRKRMEKRALWEQRRRMMMGGDAGDAGWAMSSPAAPRIQPSSQVMSSQVVASPTAARHVFSSQVVPSSQAPGLHRPKKKNKPKVARGFK